MAFCSRCLQLYLLCVGVGYCEAQSGDDGTGVQWYVWLILAIGLALAVLLIGLTSFYILNVCKKMFGNRQAVYTEEYNKSKVSLNKNLYEANELSQIKVNNEIEISRDKVEVLSVLGIGEFGALYDAEVQLTPNVKSRALIKVFEQGSSQDLVIYKQECESLLNLRHKNVVQLFGFVSSPPYFTVLELPINGDLKTFLLTVKELQTELTMPQLLAMATDAASGLSYLESIDYIHNDIAARNCVVTQSLGIKIADYKVGRYLFRSEYAVQADGSLMPVRWMAPESLMENHFSLQSDVWSFGILMWEILTVGEFPYAELSDGEVVQSICYEFQRLMQPVSCPDSTYMVMLKCWHSNPAQRLRMTYLHQQLEKSILHINNTGVSSTILEFDQI